MNNPEFRPFDANLPLEETKKLLFDALIGADDGELFVERKRAEMLSFDDGRLKLASYDASEGFGLRAVRDEVTGYAHATELSLDALTRASETVRLAVGDGGGTLAVAPRATNAKLYTSHDPMGDAPFPVKVDTLREIDAFARELDKRVVQVSASIAASLQEISILRADGIQLDDRRPMVRLNVSVIVEENGRRETGSYGGGGRVALTGLLEPESWQATV